jgi:adenylate cyclase
VANVVEVQPASAVRGAAPLSLPDKPSIAVLAFENLSGDPEQEYFADGLAEDIITCLSKFHLQGQRG